MNCPKCGVKIKPYDWRQNCRKCGTNLFLHNFNERLDADSVQAEIDYKWWTDMTDNFMNYGVKDKMSLVRLFVSLTPLVILPAPAVLYNGKQVMMLSFIMDILGGGTIFPEGFSVADMGAYKGFIPAMLLILLSILVAIVSFFSIVVGPAFMNFKAPYRFYLLVSALAISGTAVFNFVFVPDFAAQSAQALSASFGLYLYCFTVLVNVIFLRWFIGYSEKFGGLQNE